MDCGANFWTSKEMSAAAGEQWPALQKNASAHRVVDLRSESEMYATCRTFPEVHLFIGFGARAQYADMDEVVASLAPHLEPIQKRCGGKPFLAVFGGDKAKEADPDIGLLMARLRQQYTCSLLAIQAAGTSDPHVDFSFKGEDQYEVQQVEHPSGRVEELKSLLYGGLREGIPVGSTRYYLGPDFTFPIRENPRMLKSVIIVGGGEVAVQELDYADRLGVPWVYVPCRALHTDIYGSIFGPVHEWVHKRLNGAAGKVSVKGNDA